jgi:AraC-like DNA-binding protein
MTIEAIGLTSGFASKSNFFAIFKDLTGLTPYEFVKKNSPDIKE